MGMVVGRGILRGAGSEGTTQWVREAILGGAGSEGTTQWMREAILGGAGSEGTTQWVREASWIAAKMLYTGKRREMGLAA